MNNLSFWFVLALLLLAYLTNPNEAHFKEFIRSLSVYQAGYSDDSVLKNVFVNIMAWGNSNLLLNIVSYTDYGLFSILAASLLPGSLSKDYFLGIFNLWIPLPNRLVSLSESLSNVDIGGTRACNYRGIYLYDKCLCIPSYSSSQGCARPLKDFVPVAKYTDGFLGTRTYVFRTLLRKISILEVILSLMVLLYVFWTKLSPSIMWDNTTITSTFNWKSLSALILCHFSHPTGLHLCWSIFSVYWVLVPAYELFGGETFMKLLLALIITISFVHVLFIKAGLTRRTLFGLQFLVYGIMFLYHGHAFIRNSKPLNHVNFIQDIEFWRQFGRNSLLNIITSSFMFSGIDLYAIVLPLIVAYSALNIMGIK
ncbi:hypothetical protein MP638_002788 [Amoeboaphelidium occidentale]|nr:hypothetical protein MP638_002788 [Amoeboaphelidium occidentale]